MKKQIIGCISLSLLASAVYAGEDAATLNIANEYLAAYQAFDVTKMASFYAENARFTDPTSAVFGPENTYIMNGKEAIVRKLSQFVTQNGVIKLDFDIVHQYEAAGHVVFNANVHVQTGSGQAFRSGCAAITTIIHIENSKVIEHRDYFDYHQYLATLSKTPQDCSKQTKMLPQKSN